MGFGISSGFVVPIDFSGVFCGFSVTIWGDGDSGSGADRSGAIFRDHFSLGDSPKIFSKRSGGVRVCLSEGGPRDFSEHHQHKDFIIMNFSSQEVTRFSPKSVIPCEER